MRRVLPWLLVGLGAALVETGVALFAAANRAWAVADFGWSAYGPLSPAQDPSDTYAFSAAVVLWNRQHVLGAGLLLLGLLSLVGVGGWLLGRRAGRRAGPGG